MAVVNINVNYFRGFIVSDRLTVATRIDNIRVKSAFLLPENYTWKNAKRELVSDAMVTFVFIDLLLNKAITISGELLEKLELLSKNDSDAFINAK